MERLKTAHEPHTTYLYFTNLIHGLVILLQLKVISHFLVRLLELGTIEIVGSKIFWCNLENIPASHNSTQVKCGNHQLKLYDLQSVPFHRNYRNEKAIDVLKLLLDGYSLRNSLLNNCPSCQK